MTNSCDGGEAILEALRNLKIEYVISSPGSEWASVWEAFARQKTDGKAGPTYIDCWHENVAVDMAIGYTQYTGKMQCVLLHAGAGLLQGSMAVQTAHQSETPMLLMSGESLSLGENPDFDPGLQWYRGLSIVGGPQRLMEPLVKHASQATSVYTLFETVIRAGELAQRQPAGPVYLNVPIETMIADWTPPAKMRTIPAAPKMQPVLADIQAVADRLVSAKNPVIEAEGAGRDPAAVAALIDLAELLGAGVVDGRSSVTMNFPQSHPLYQGQQVQAVARTADVVLLVNARAPWYPPSSRPLKAFIAAVGDNPIKNHWTYQHLHADAYLEGDLATTLRLLAEAVRAAGVTAETHRDRRENWGRAHDKLVTSLRAAEAAVQDQNPIDPLWLCTALRETLPADTIYVDEVTTHSGIVQQHLNWSQPQSYFYALGGLGQGIGLALGIKLAAPERPVALLIGDGTLLYNPIIQALGASRDGKLPILIVVFNNGKYRAMQNNHERYYPDGVAAKHDLWHGVNIDGPDYEGFGSHFGFYGRKVDDPAELKAAIAEALAAVQGGRTAILNVVLNR